MYNYRWIRILATASMWLISACQLSAQSGETWERIFMRSINIEGKSIVYMASSELEQPDPFEGERGKYSPLNLFDDDISTAWVEGVEGSGRGEYLYLSAGTILPNLIYISNGYQKSEGLYSSNSRVKELTITLCAGLMMEGDVTEIAEVYYMKPLTAPFTTVVDDNREIQSIELPWSGIAGKISPPFLESELRVRLREEIEERKNWCPDCPDRFGFSLFLKLEIADTWPGLRWEDTCISELEIPEEGSRVLMIPPDESIIRVYESEIPGNEGVIYADTDKRSGLVLADRARIPELRNLTGNESLEIILMDLSPDNEWVQIDYMFYSGEEGRVEEYSVLYHTRSLDRVDRRILDDIYGAAGFVSENGRLYLDTAEGLIDLREIELSLLSPRAR